VEELKVRSDYLALFVSRLKEEIAKEDAEVAEFA